MTYFTSCKRLSWQITLTIINSDSAVVGNALNKEYATACDRLRNNRMILYPEKCKALILSRFCRVSPISSCPCLLKDQKYTARKLFTSIHKIQVHKRNIIRFGLKSVTYSVVTWNNVSDTIRYNFIL